MTKHRSYVLARAELWSKAVTEKQIKDRSIEIYAGSFAEWLGNNYMFHLNLWFTKEPATDMYVEDIINYTTSELIAEFEKQ